MPQLLGLVGFQQADIQYVTECIRIAPLNLPLHAGVTAVHCPEGLHLRALSPMSVNPALHPK